MTHRILSVLMLGAALGLSACMGGAAGGDGPAPLLPTTRYTLQVEPGVDRIALAAHEHGLSGAQQAAIQDLVGRFHAEGASVIRVEAPAGGDPVATQAAWRVRSAIEALGVPAERIQVGGYDGPDPRAPILAGFETLRAVVPQCGTNWTNLTRSAQNQTSANFGCAVTANLAAQIANPRDIVQPRDMPPGDAGRRAVVFAAYRAGERTSAPQEELVANRRVSRAVE